MKVTLALAWVAVALGAPSAAPQDDNPVWTLTKAYREAEWGEERMDLLRQLAALAREDPTLVDRVTKEVVRGLDDQDERVRAVAAELLPDLDTGRGIKALAKVFDGVLKELRELDKDLASLFRKGLDPILYGDFLLTPDQLRERNRIQERAQALHGEQAAYVAALARMPEDRAVDCLGRYVEAFPFSDRTHPALEALLAFGTFNALEAAVVPVRGYQDRHESLTLTYTTLDLMRKVLEEQKIELPEGHPLLDELQAWGAYFQSALAAFADAHELTAPPGSLSDPKAWDTWREAVKKALPKDVAAKQREAKR